MTKKPSPRNKEWEKDRRDRLNQTFNDLAKLLPQYDPAATSFSKIEILQKSIALIEELQKELKDLRADTKNPILADKQDNQEATLNHSKPTIALDGNVDQKSEQEAKAGKVTIKPKRKYTRRKGLVTKVPEISISNEVPDGRNRTKKERPHLVKPLIKILREGRKTKVIVKSEVYAKIRRHVLKCKKRKDAQFRRRKLKTRSLAKDMQLPSVEQRVKDSFAEEIEKPLDEINSTLPNHMSNSELTADLFVALQVPQAASNSGSLSPTEAFLMSFPVVSGALASGKANDQAVCVSEPAVQLVENLFSPKDDYSAYRLLDGKPLIGLVEPQKDAVDQNKPNYLVNNIMNVYDVNLQQKPLDTQFCSNQIGGPPLLDSHFEIMEKTPFTFSLTPATVFNQPVFTPERSGNRASSVKHPSHLISGAYPGAVSSLSTDTKTTNSWSYNVKKLSLISDLDATNCAEMYQPHINTSVEQNYTNSQPFTFSLTTKSTDTIAVSTTKTSQDQMPSSIFGSNSGPSTSSISFDGSYNASFNSFPLVSNSFLATRPPPPPHSALTTDGQQYGTTNAFSFQLTSTSNSQPTYTAKPVLSQPNALNPFLSPKHAPHGKPGNKPADQSRREKPVRKSSGIADKKKNNNHAEPNANKFHVNWMTETMRNPSNEYNYPQNSNQATNYLSTPTTIDTATMPIMAGACREDYNQKSDIFFAHPPGDERFLWGKSSGCQSMEIEKPRSGDFNVSQLLPLPPPAPAFVPPTTLPGDYQPNGNHFSVSNLVDPTKKYLGNISGSAELPSVNLGGNQKWKSSNAPWEVDYNKTHQPVSNSSVRPSVSKNYTAEALISNSQTYPEMGTSANYRSSNKRFVTSNIFSLQETVDGGGDTETLDFNYNFINSQSQFGPKTDYKMNHQQMGSQETAANPFPFYSNDFLQPLFPAPTVPLLSDPVAPTSTAMKGKQPSTSSNKGQKRKLHYGDAPSNAGPFILPQCDPVPSGRQHQHSYDLGSTSSFFASTAPQPHPLLVNHCSESFHYPENSKMSQSFVPAPPLDFNSTVPVPSGTSHYPTNCLTNFNLSSICPEINNPLH